MTNQWLVSRFNITSFIGDLTWLNLLLRVLRALVSVLVSQVQLLVSLNNGGNGLLSGLLGGSNQNMISTLQAENSLLKTILIRMPRKSTHSLLQTTVDSMTKPLLSLSLLLMKAANNRVELAFTTQLSSVALIRPLQS